MKFNKILAITMAMAAMALTACSDDKKDDEPENKQETQKPEADPNLKDILFNSGKDLGNGRQEFEIKGKYTLPKGTYNLKGWVYVTSGSELTLAPGTILLGDKDTKAALIVEPGGKLWAQGTPQEPIVMTSAQAPGKRRPGDWGGLIICGQARNNQGKMAIEGGPRTIHGGDNDDDCSGALSYLRVEFAGYPFAPDQEINGVTFGSVGRGTKVDHVQVSYSNDDSFEWFGGAVNCNHLIAYHGWDDDFDTDNGFSGHVQFCLGQRNSRLADQSISNGFESDNCGDAATKEPYTSCVFSNVTFVGPKVDNAFSNTSDYINAGSLNPNNGSRLGQFQAAMQIRRNSHLSCYNSVAIGYPIGLIIENDKGARTQQAAQEGVLKLANLYFATMDMLGSDKNKSFKNFFSSDATAFDESKESFSATFFKAQPTCKYFDKVADLKLNSQYRPTAGSPLLQGASFTGLTGFEIVPYAGAFSGAGDNWADLWTCFDPQNKIY